MKFIESFYSSFAHAETDPVAAKVNSPGPVSSIGSLPGLQMSFTQSFCHFPQQFPLILDILWNLLANFLSSHFYRLHFYFSQPVKELQLKMLHCLIQLSSFDTLKCSTLKKKVNAIYSLIYSVVRTSSWLVPQILTFLVVNTMPLF